ncbi:adenosylcobinamide-phosphate synthase CbiB [Colwellia sp. MSW7]|uniref:Cobalamin biosynthesis protein CobD n=1 Tax=Colwellia maritima TaxID=2912588 RepID=A0ABS9X1F5_9GAMM|nr:adenosylcobinamide-phosphate synthase CbiB [Colwellia maritima]MCI2284083.1 adenosylcobinamide-phosphate synthase CbiB [Colwellia maritima]
MFDNSFLTSAFLLVTQFKLSLTLILALLLDHFLGEPKRYHPLVGFGFLASTIELWLNKKANQGHVFSKQNALRGLLAWCLLILPFSYFTYILLNLIPTNLQFLLEVLFLYAALGLNSLDVHAKQVFTPLNQGDLSKARHYTSYLVSRETDNLSANDMSRATVESMLENGHDAVIASLVYYLIGGIPLVILHRLANTLDAMWGYKTDRFNSFGFFAARADDVLGFLTGKVCTLLYALQQPFFQALKNAYQQGDQYKSHNGGWVMAAGATVMQISLGGNATYHNKIITSPTLGLNLNENTIVKVTDIPRSITVVKRAAMLLVLFIFIYQLTFYIFV